MFTSFKRSAIAITAIIAVSAPSVASARYFDSGGTSPVPPGHVVQPSPGPNPDEQFPWNRASTPTRRKHQFPLGIGAKTAAQRRAAIPASVLSVLTPRERQYVLGIVAMSAAQFQAAFGTDQGITAMSRAQQPGKQVRPLPGRARRGSCSRSLSASS